MTVPSPKRVFPHPPRSARLGFGEPPYKRAKTHHAPNSVSPAQLCGDKTTAAPIAFLPTCDQSPRPLTSCASNFNEGSDPQAPANFQSVLSLPFDHRVPQGFDYASLFGNPTAPSRTDPAPAKDYIPQHEALVSSSSNAPPSPASSQLGPPMIFSFGPQAVFPSFDHQCTLHNYEPAPVNPEWANTDLSLFWDPFDSMNFSHLLSSGPPLDPLSHNPGDMAQQNNPPSPFSRSMSRSSFASSSYPDDYPTPGSDTTAVTTPAPSEGCLGSPSEHPQVLLGQDFLLSVEGKKGDHELSYVSGSAPLSTSHMLDFSLPQAPTLPPTSNAAPLSTARRHSEPANLATCNFPSFFVPCHEVSPQVMSAPGDSMTHSIADNLVSSGSASGSHSVPSSIAPHQTQLPPLQHPRPVRPFKPQILLSGLHYDPKDFVRRRSEPILPLPELDVASHIPLDIVPEADEDGDLMEVEDPGLFEEFSEEGCAEQSFDIFGDSSSWIGSESQDLPLFNEWSWPQSESTGTQPAQRVGFVKASSQVPISFSAVGWNTY